MEKNILFKIHKSYRWVVAICDEELAGKYFSEGNRQIDLTGKFFRGDVMKEEKIKSEIRRCIREDATFNVVGERSIEILKKIGLTKNENIFWVDGVPFVLILL